MTTQPLRVVEAAATWFFGESEKPSRTCALAAGAQGAGPEPTAHGIACTVQHVLIEHARKHAVAHATAWPGELVAPADSSHVVERRFAMVQQSRPCKLGGQLTGAC